MSMPLNPDMTAEMKNYYNLLTKLIEDDNNKIDEAKDQAESEEGE